MNSVNIKDLRIKLRDYLEEARNENKVIYVENYRKPVAAIVPIKYAKIIEKLMQAKE